MINETSPELKQKMLEWEKRNPQNKQLQILQDVADMLQELISISDGVKSNKEESENKFGSLLVDIKESLGVMTGKKDPEQKDFTAPLLKVLQSIEKTQKEKDYSPKIDVKSPNVTVPKPEVKVNIDAPKLDKLEQLIKKELPKAFRESIALIPEVKIPESVDRWDDVLEWLESIDTATRLKPLPGSMTVTSSTLATEAKQLPDGHAVAEATKSNLLPYAKIRTASDTISPTAGNKLEIVWVQVIPSSDNSNANLVTLSLASIGDLYTVFALGRSAVFTGATDEDLDITLATAEPVSINIQYREIT
jgi:hypothetical protein